MQYACHWRHNFEIAINATIQPRNLSNQMFNNISIYCRAHVTLTVGDNISIVHSNDAMLLSFLIL